MVFPELEGFNDGEEVVDESFAHGADGGKHCEELFHGKIRLVDGDKYRETEG